MRAYLAKLFAAGALGATTLVVAPSALAGMITDENSKPGWTGSWPADDDGTARFDGVVDVYPAEWSIARGDTIRLKVRSTTPYAVRVLRLGWYGGAGAREVASATGRPPNPQPYPTPDPDYGLAEAKWSVTDQFTTDATWTPGLYVARVEQQGGKQGLTFFVVRDDGVQPKAPILLVVGTHTHQAYNAWPGPERGGKSLYGFNSSPSHPSQSIGTLNQAVRVSYDRPFFVGGGTADVGGYEYPFVRWLEKNGYEVAYATDLDLHRDPGLAKGRRVVAFSGHEEYTTWEMFDNVIAARDAGTNFLFLSGDTWSWQVRLEAGAAGPHSTVVGYKESWVKDPEQREAYKLREAGNVEDAKKHFRKVTRGWKNLETDPGRGIDLRRPGMLITGVQSSGIIRDAAGNPMHGGLYPWAHMTVDAPDHWLFEGTGLKRGDVLPNVFGYEVDSTMRGTPDYVAFRPAGQTKLGTIKQVSDGTPKGAAGFYQKHLGGDKRVEVVSLSAIFFAWALDDFAAPKGGGQTSIVPAADTMMHNVLRRWTGDAPIPPVDAPPVDGVDPGGGYDPEDAGDPVGNTNDGSTSDSGGCATSATKTSSSWALGLVTTFAIVVAARRRRASAER